MDLKKYLPGKDKDDTHEYLWALVIEPGWVQAGIWRIEGERAQVMFAGTSMAWEQEEDLVNAIDSALSHAISSFPEDLKEPSKTVFGVVSSWVENGEIKKEHLEKVKKICTELSLKPVGFVVLPEAIAHLTKTEEGSPLTAVILGIFKENIEMSLFRLGDLSGSTVVARSVSLVDDVAEGLSRFIQGENIPSRFIIYNGRDAQLDEAKQSLHQVSWDDFESLKFLHTPKVETIDSKRKIDATSLAGASELADVTSIQTVKDEEDKREKVVESREAEFEKSPEDFGFALEKDVAGQSKVAKSEVSQPQGIVDENETKNMGLDNIEPVEIPKKRKLHLPGNNLLSVIAGKFMFVGRSFNRIVSTWSRFSKRSSSGRKPLFFGFGFLLVLIIAGIVGWWFYPKATVTIYVAPKLLSEKFSVSIDPSIETSDFDSGKLVANVHKTSISGEKTKPTTGTKTVGEKAQGEVTIYRAGSELTLPVGTVITGPNNLAFSLDNDVTLASGSAGTPGKTNTSVTAEDIGAQFNLASGATFSVGNYSSSDLEAKNESSFSGGSSSEINAVSKEDQDELLDELHEELEEKAKKELLEGISSDMILIEDSIITTLSSTSFSSKVGDEATNLKLDLELDAQIFTVEKESLTSMAESILNSKVPDGFVLRKEQLEMDFKIKDEDDELANFQVTVKANLLPKVDTDEVARKIVGKYPQLAKEFLSKEVPGFVRVEIKMRPVFPGKLGTLPRVVKNIDVELAAER